MYAYTYLVNTILALLCSPRDLECLVADDVSARTGFVPGSLVIQHHDDVVDGAKQHLPHETPKQPIQNLPRPEVIRKPQPVRAI